MYQLNASYTYVKDYAMSCLTCGQRLYLAQLRIGILPLHVEMGRWQRTEVDKRIDKVCNSNLIENEVLLHFMFHFNKYINIILISYHISYYVAKYHIFF